MNSLAGFPAPVISPRVRTFVALAVLYVVWSSTYLALRHVVVAMPPMMTGGGRFLVAGAILFALQRLRGEPGPARHDWAPAAVSGALLFAGGNGLVCIAETRVSSGVAAVACASTPLFVAGLGALWGERPSRRELGGLALGFAGVLTLGASADLAIGGARGMLLLASPLAWAMGTVIARKARPASPMTFAAQQMVCGAVAMLLASAAMRERVPHHVPTTAWLSLGYLALFGSVVAFPAFSFLVKHARPAVATSYAYVNPVLAVMLGAAIGGESLTRTSIVALALVLAAVVVVASGSALRGKPGITGVAARPVAIRE